MFKITQERFKVTVESDWVLESGPGQKDDFVFEYLFEMRKRLLKNRYKLYELNQIIRASCE